MTTYSIKLVNHTPATPRLQNAIKSGLQDLFNQTFSGTPDNAMVDWGTGTPSDAVVIHLVEDIANSYIQQKMPGNEIRGDAGGHTRNRSPITGSEIYLFALVGERRTMLVDRAYARLAYHEAIHNQWPGWKNDEIHNLGGLAHSPPQEPLTDANKEFMRRGLSMKNAQLL